MTGRVAKFCHQELFQVNGCVNDKRLLEVTMQSNIEPSGTPDYAFQVDLLNLNLHLAETEKFSDRYTEAIESALTQLRTTGRSV